MQEDSEQRMHQSGAPALIEVRVHETPEAVPYVPEPLMDAPAPDLEHIEHHIVQRHVSRRMPVWGIALAASVVAIGVGTVCGAIVLALVSDATKPHDARSNVAKPEKKGEQSAPKMTVVALTPLHYVQFGSFRIEDGARRMAAETKSPTFVSSSPPFVVARFVPKDDLKRVPEGALRKSFAGSFSVPEPWSSWVRSTRQLAIDVVAWTDRAMETTSCSDATFHWGARWKTWRDDPSAHDAAAVVQAWNDVDRSIVRAQQVCTVEALLAVQRAVFASERAMHDAVQATLRTKSGG
jgi:hypothetical protein